MLFTKAKTISPLTAEQMVLKENPIQRPVSLNDSYHRELQETFSEGFKSLFIFSKYFNCSLIILCMYEMYFDHTPPFPFQLPPDLSKMTFSQLHALIFFFFIFFKSSNSN